MYNLNENTPLGALTVGQLLEIIEQKTACKIPELKEEPKADRTGIDGVISITGLSSSQIYKLTAKNAIPCQKFGKRLVFSTKAIMEWMEQHTTEKENSKQKAARQLTKLAMKRNKNA